MERVDLYTQETEKNKEMGAEVVKHISEGIKSGKESPVFTVEDRGYKIERANKS